MKNIPRYSVQSHHTYYVVIRIMILLTIIYSINVIFPVLNINHRRYGDHEGL